MVKEGLWQLTRLIKGFLCVSHTESVADLRADARGGVVNCMAAWSKV